VVAVCDLQFADDQKEVSLGVSAPPVRRAECGLSVRQKPLLEVRVGDFGRNYSSLLELESPALTMRLFIICQAAATAARGAEYQLKASPGTLVWGYYSAAAKPVLKIQSGDTVEVQTLLTNSPERLEAAGVKPSGVQPELKAITAAVKDKGPGGHILTGPVFVEGAEPGDVLDLCKIRLGIPYAYNSFSPQRGC
jgi:hypothetical protein